ncbi:hypothetical protein BpHYR1_050602 [Brachionus plicatilis]|uniref:Uncharacterized protein n=1 Tax=Brachionus plicatilis TaxID=10195 RepID=A0A3M7SV91_BRAPC|nr:hypothetical protein BpHYR1_050602 [Brachionus plicatilis]
MDANKIRELWINFVLSNTKTIIASLALLALYFFPSIAKKFDKYLEIDDRYIVSAIYFNFMVLRYKIEEQYEFIATFIVAQDVITTTYFGMTLNF